MLSIVKRKFMSLAEILHLRIFGHEMSDEMRKFLGHLSWSFLGIFFSSLMLFFVNILAGRILGPEGYGRYNLTLVIANIITIPILLGMDITSIKYISHARNQLDKKKYLTNSFWIVVFSSFTILVLGIISYSKIAVILKISPELLFIALIFSILLSFKNLLGSFIRSFYFFRFQSIARIIESVTVIFFFILFYYVLDKIGFQYYLASLITGSLILCVIYFAKIKKNIIHYDKEKAGEIFNYSKATVSLVCILIIMNSMDRLFIVKFLGVRTLGIYSAYLTVTMIFVSQVVLMLNNVFFPMINSAEKKDVVIRKVDRLGFFLFIPGVIFISVCSFLILKLYGREFQLNQWYILLFSALAFLQIPSDFYRNIASSESGAYFKMKRLFFLIPLLFFFLYYLVLSRNNANNFFYAVLIYSLYIVFYFFIVRISCKSLARQSD